MSLKRKMKIEGATLIPVDPPCANFQFATMEGRELTCGDFHARAAFPPPQVYSRRLKAFRFRRLRFSLRASFAIPARSPLGGCRLAAPASCNQQLTEDNGLCMNYPHVLLRRKGVQEGKMNRSPRHSFSRKGSNVPL